MKIRILSLFHHFVRNFLLKRYYRKTTSTIFQKGSEINKETILMGYNYLGIKTQFLDSYLGFASYVANNSRIKNTKIGRFCAIGDNVKTCLGIHPTRKFVSIHPAFFSLIKQAGFTFARKQLFNEHKYVDERKRFVVEIGNDVWIGNNVLIMDGVKVGDGAIIGAGSIVTKNIEAYSVVGGIPARVIRKRFSQEEINFLIQFKWWDKDFKWLRVNSLKFQNIKEFVRFFNNKSKN